MSTVDVVVPCYNYGRYLRGCVESVLSQRDVQVGVLIIDDSSSDDTRQIGKALAVSDRRVQFRRHDVNHGHIVTYNEGLLGWSTADYVVLLSADDMLTPGSLGRAVRLMERNKNVGMVYGRTVHFQSEDDLPTITPRECAYTQWSGADWIERRCKAGHNVITSPEVVVRGSVQRAVGGYKPELPHAGDLEMWLRIARIANIAFVHEVQAFYRVHPKSMLRTKYRASILDLRQRKAAFDIFLQSYKHVTIEASRLEDLMNHALAREALWDACRAYDRDEVEEADAADLEQFALTCYGRATSLDEYAALRRRKALGPTLCNRIQLFAMPALLRRLRRTYARYHWERYGA